MIAAEQTLCDLAEEQVKSSLALGIVHKLAEYRVFSCDKREFCRCFVRNLSRKSYITGRACYHYIILAVRCVPIAKFLVIVAERPLVEPECDRFAFSGLKLDLDEIFKFLFGTNSKARFIRYIKLYDFLACTVAGIRDNRIYCENIIIAYCGVGELYIGIFKCCIG